jgi:hypothetical protein
MSADELIVQCGLLGAELVPQPNGRLKVKAKAPLAPQFLAQLREKKREILSLLTTPHLNERGELMIPLTVEQKYRWWDGGHSLHETLRELGASAETIARYVEPQRTVLH